MYPRLHLISLTTFPAAETADAGGLRFVEKENLAAASGICGFKLAEALALGKGTNFCAAESAVEGGLHFSAKQRLMSTKRALCLLWRSNEPK